MHIQTDVLITGAGPSGLMLACQLINHHTDFTIINNQDNQLLSSGALVIHASSIEIFHEMGILEDVMKKAVIINELRFKFGKYKPVSIPVRRYHDSSAQNPDIMLLPQKETIATLTDYLAKRGKEVENMQLVGFTKKDGVILSDCITPDNREVKITSGYLVGADGKNSLVRTLSHFSYRDKKDKLPLFIMDFEGTSPARVGEMYFKFDKTSSFGLFPLSSDTHRLDGSIPSLGKSEEKIHKEDVLKSIPPEAKVSKIYWFSVFHGNYLLCDSFGRDNIFLAGDAAHTHNPVGGQGMNSGFQDSVNLAWKLAYVIKGLARRNILDTYSDERRPPVKRIMDLSSIVYDFIAGNRTLAGLRLITGFSVTRLFGLLFGFRFFREWMLNSVSQLWIRYKGSLTASSHKHKRLKAGKRMILQGLRLKTQSTHNFRLLIFIKSPVELNYQQLKGFPLEIEQITINEKIAFFKQQHITKNTWVLLRPDNYIAMVLLKPDYKRIENYFKKLMHEANTVRT